MNNAMQEDWKGCKTNKSRPQYAILATGILGEKGSFERRLREAAPTSLALTYLIVNGERR